MQTFSAKLDHAARNLQVVKDTGYASHVEAAIALLLASFKSGGKLLVCGNGGSAADAQHICGELVGRFLINRAPLSAIALSSDASVVTAWGNDFEFETIFSRQVEAHGKPGDTIWGISTSGNSKNVVRALEMARKMQLRTVGLTGEGGGLVAAHCDVLMAVPLKSTPDIQEIHLMTYHYICAGVESALFGEGKNG